MTSQSIFKRPWLIVLAVIMLIYTLISIFSHPKPKLAEPSLPVAMSPFKNTIAGVGSIEPESENIAIGTSISGIITKVYVTVGQKVKVNEPLFTIDSRDASARLTSQRAKLTYAQALATEAQNQLRLYERIDDKRAISVEELTRRRDKVALNNANVDDAKAALNIVETEIDRLTVKSPINGTVLKVSARLGEYAPTGILAVPLMIIGNTEVMYVRVEVDETNSQGLSPDAKAVGFLRGYDSQSIPLKYVRTEPLLTSKRSLSNKGSELVDTRVMVILYSFDNVKIRAHVGQQMDVYIDYEKNIAPK